MIRVHKGNLNYLRDVWKRMREGDRIELNYPGLCPEHFADPDLHPMVRIVDRRPEFAFGYLITGNAINIWGFGTDKTDDHMKSLTIHAKAYIELLAEEYPEKIIQLMVHKHNSERIKWHLLLGFREIGFQYWGYTMLRYIRKK